MFTCNRKALCSPSLLDQLDSSDDNSPGAAGQMPTGQNLSQVTQMNFRKLTHHKASNQPGNEPGKLINATVGGANELKQTDINGQKCQTSQLDENTESNETKSPTREASVESNQDGSDFANNSTDASPISPVNSDSSLNSNSSIISHPK